MEQDHLDLRQPWKIRRINPGDAAFPTAGTHTYEVTITDANGCTNTSSVDVTVFDNPTVSASAASEAMR